MFILLLVLFCSEMEPRKDTKKSSEFLGKVEGKVQWEYTFKLLCVHVAFWNKKSVLDKLAGQEILPF